MTIQPQHIAIDREQARDLYRSYKAHVHYAKPIDLEIQRIYQLIAQGRLVIRAIESIVAAGLDAQGRPKLAIVRADAKQCFYSWRSNHAHFEMDQWTPQWQWRRRVSVPHDRLRPVNTHWLDARATPPEIPLHLRPRRGLADYHILWEATWDPTPPEDPFLLRRIGKSDAWLVVAAWDLSDVEKAVLATRMQS